MSTTDNPSGPPLRAADRAGDLIVRGVRKTLIAVPFDETSMYLQRVGNITKGLLGSYGRVDDVRAVAAFRVGEHAPSPGWQSMNPDRPMKPSDVVVFLEITESVLSTLGAGV